MCIIGNPPYSVSSTNKSEWIEKLVRDYKKDLNERNIQPLSDDYIKFIRFGQHFIDKNGSGVLAYISNSSFTDGIIHRQMRKHLLESFDKVYVLDLHGNSRIKEISPDGSNDQNVFDIMAGVSINIFIKTGNKKKKELGKVFLFDLFGKRDDKYDFLINNKIQTVDWNNIKITSPEFLISNKDFSLKNIYSTGFSINDLFQNNNSGLATEFDELVIHYAKKDAQTIIEDLKLLSEREIINKYHFSEKQIPKIVNAKKDLDKNNPNIYPINYRPFDKRYCIYTGSSNGVMGRPRNSTMQHFIKNKNIGIVVSRSVYGSYDWYDIQITNEITEKGIMAMRVGNAAIICPLYLYPQSIPQQSIESTTERTPNLNLEIVNQIADKIGLIFTNEKEATKNTFAPIDILDYIYAVLHSPSYREKYKEFLKIDFPRVPYPEDKVLFWKLVKLGGELRQLHLLESPITEKYITKYPVNGDNIVTKLKFEPYYYELTTKDKDGNLNYPDYLGAVKINDTQYFADVPTSAWEFYIGGYQPAQKWLKDRKGRSLSFDDILHYQKIIVALTETGRLMREIDEVIEI